MPVPQSNRYIRPLKESHSRQHSTPDLRARRSECKRNQRNTFRSFVRGDHGSDFGPICPRESQFLRHICEHAPSVEPFAPPSRSAMLRERPNKCLSRYSVDVREKQDLQGCSGAPPKSYVRCWTELIKIITAELDTQLVTGTVARSCGRECAHTARSTFSDALVPPTCGIYVAHCNVELALTSVAHGVATGVW